jgi:glycosyltransferase involved in cell wall biosynthesis
MTKTGLVSVIIPAYNAQSHLRRAIDSVFSQTRSSIEVIVIDDGSTDETATVCKQYGTRVRYFFQDNKGASVARNFGVAKAFGEVVIFLDADDELNASAIEALADPLFKNEGAGGCSGILLLKGSGEHDFLRPPKDCFPSGSIPLYSVSQRHPVSSATGVAVRRSYFEKVGGFSAGVHFGEDIELWNKLYGQYDWYFVNEQVGIYFRSAESSVTCRVPFYEHGLGYIWSDHKMRQLVHPSKWEEYRQYKLCFLLAKARLSFKEGCYSFGKEALKLVDVERDSLRYLKWTAIYMLPEKLWNGLRVLVCK